MPDSRVCQRRLKQLVHQRDTAGISRTLTFPMAWDIPFFWLARLKGFLERQDIPTGGRDLASSASYSSMAPTRRSGRSAVPEAGTRSTPPTKVKPEQVKEEKVKAESANGERVVASDDEAGSVGGVNDAEVDGINEEQHDPEGSPKGTKRARVDVEGNTVQGNQDEEEEPVTIKPRTVTLPRDDDG